MKSCLKLCSILMIVCVFLSSTVCGEVFDITPEQYVLNQISHISETDQLCQWTRDTEIDETITLYGANDSPNGYVYTLTTNGELTGYMQINAFDTDYNIHSFSYKGTNEVIKMLESFSADSVFGDVSLNVIVQDSKIYYAGSFLYAIEYDNQLYDLSSHDVLGVTKEEFLSEYQIDVQTDNVSPRSVLTDEGSTMVYGYNAFTLVEMDDFAGRYIYGGHNSLVSNHCTPTAATNVVKYFAQACGISELYRSTTWLTFQALYRNMNTNAVNESQKNHTGTIWSIVHSYGYSGLLDYVESQDVAFEDAGWYAMGAVSKPSLNTLKQIINDDCPIVLTIKSFPGGSGQTDYHSVVMFGYFGNQLILSNGWDKEYHYYSYSDLKIHEYFFVEFDIY